MKVKDVSELTGFPEMMDGRVKTLHPKVHGGLLAIRDNAEHAQRDEDARHRADRSAGGQSLSVRGDRRKGADFEECIENIDIGGPAMIRAAAKNHDDVAVVVDPADYQAVLDELDGQQRRDHAGAAPRASPPRPMPAPPPMTPRSRTGSRDELKTDAPDFRAFGGRLIQPLRYGENPHQKAAFYRTPRQAPGRRHRAAAAGQGTVLQQHQRHRCGL